MNIDISVCFVCIFLLIVVESIRMVKPGERIVNPTKNGHVHWEHDLFEAKHNRTSVTEMHFPIWKDNQMDALKRCLLANYTSPSAAYIPATNVDLSVNDLYLNEKKGLFEIRLYLNMKWRDRHLKWDKSDFNGISLVHFDIKQIWTPEIVAYDVLDDNSDTNTLSLVQSNGTALHVDTHKYTVFCPVNLAFWPFDEQRCSIKFEPRGYTYTNKFDIEYDDYTRIGWVVKEASCIEALRKYYISVSTICTLTLQRNWTVHRPVVVTFSLCILLLILSGYMLPIQRKDKFILNFVATLVIVATLNEFTEWLHIDNGNVPLFVIFLNSSLILNATSMVLSIVLIKISDRNIPIILPKFLTNIIERISFRAALVWCELRLKMKRRVVTPPADEDILLDDDTNIREIETDLSYVIAKLEQFSFVVYLIVLCVYWMANALEANE